MSNNIKKRKQLALDNPGQAEEELEDLISGIIELVKTLARLYSVTFELDRLEGTYIQLMPLVVEIQKICPNSLDFQMQVMDIYSKMGLFKLRMQEYDLALQYFEEYMGYARKLKEAYPLFPHFKHCWALAHYWLAEADVELVNWGAALNHFHQASNILDELSKANPDNIDFQLNLANS